MKLIQSNVIFDPVTHTYTLNGNRLSGITNVINQRTRPGHYDDIPPHILQNASEEGTRMHNQIENYEEYGLLPDDSPELSGYIAEKIAHQELSSFVTSEYIVTDSKQYASGIDLVFQSPENPSFAILVDLKRTATLDKDYVSWQLSVYAHLFELQNPHLTVQSIYALHLRNDTHQLILLPRHSSEEVRKLLYTDNQLPSKSADSRLYPQIAAAEAAVVSLKRQADEAREKYERLTNGLREIMLSKRIKKYEGEHITITKVEGSTRTSFDSRSLKKKYPDIYQEFVRTSHTEPSVRIKINDQCAMETDG